MTAQTTFTAEQMVEIAKMLQATKNDPASTTLTGGTLHGAFGGNANQLGLFSSPGVRPERFSAQPQPRSIMRLLTPERSEFINELVEIQTGQTAAGTTNATGWCGNPPTVGELKVMQQVYKFGSYFVKTNLNAIPNIGKLVNRADLPGEILNYAMQENPLIPDLAARITDTRSQLRLELYKIGNQVAIDSEKVFWNGTYTGATQNNYNGWFNEPAGIAGMVKTGYTDSVTGIAAPAADSFVRAFSAAIDGTNADGLDIVEAVHNMYWTVQQRAIEVGMDSTNFGIFMRLEMFRALTEVWACNYATYRCRTGRDAGDPVVTDGMNVQNLRTAMMRGQYLLIDGMEVPVYFSDGITLERSGGSTTKNIFTSDIFILPLSWNGRQLVRWQYFPMDNQYAREYVNAFNLTDDMEFLNNGLWFITKRWTGACFEYLLGLQMRWWLETPFLAARLDDITFNYFAGTRVADPAVTALYADGGVTYRS